MRRQTRKTEKVEKRVYYATREEWVTDKENEEEAVNFEIELDTRRKSQKKQGTSNRIIMKVIQLEDEPFLKTWRIKKVIELEKDVSTATTPITEEHQRQHVEQKQPFKSYPPRHSKTDVKANNCKQGASSIIPV